MSTIGTVYLVRATRSDGGQITYRTTDRTEALSVARRFGTTVESE